MADAAAASPATAAKFAMSISQRLENRRFRRAQDGLVEHRKDAGKSAGKDSIRDTP